MSKPQQHIIGRINIDSELPSGRAEGERFSRLLSRGLQEQLLPALDRAFAEIVNSTEYLRIPVLDVVVDWAQPGRDPSDLLDGIQKQLLDTLEGLQREQPALDSGPDQTDVRRISWSRQVLETISHILHTGAYPWWWPPGKWPVLMKQLSRVTAEAPEFLRKWLAELALDQRPTRQRFLTQLQAKLRREILSLYWSREEYTRVYRELDVLYRWMTAVFTGAMPSLATAVEAFLLIRVEQATLPPAGRRLWESALDFWLLEFRIGPPGTSERSRLLSIQGITRQEREMLAVLHRIVGGNAAERFAYARLADRLPELGLNTAQLERARRWLSGRSALDEETRKQLEARSHRMEPDLRQHLSALLERETPRGGKQEERVAEAREFPEAGLFIPNAGLIILHPFLLLFFEKLGLCRDRQFVDDRARERAVYVLQYLCSGKSRAPEPELVLNKVLCGLPTAAVLTGSFRLSRKVKQEADDLLDAVLGHWQALGNTSKEGLRANFLLREGKLMPGSTGRRLLVERKPQDILLERLPWGISMLKLPWMEDYMSIEW